ncbi:Class II abasic (AP) endonuclease [Thecaphora frezii]
MRIVVWNVNGLRTLRGYQPWYRLPSWQACLEHLEADIACFQETKVTRKQLQEWMCMLPDYHAFFDFHPTRGYSGTVTYVKKAVCIPRRAESGITGRLVNVRNDEGAIGGYPTDVRDDIDEAIWHGLDAEGRAVVIDCGLFVLFNLYAPNETGPERLEYKMSYYHCLEERAHRLIEAGRQVVIVGDMNIIRDPIDHCDPEQSIREHGWTHFKEHPARAWYDTFLAPRGKFHDVGRIYHPTRTRMFTNWNTLIDARPANYGVRLDYTLVTEGLLPWIKGADIQQHIYGSDHCPIYLDLHDSRQIDGETVLLKDLLDGGAARPPPPLAACFYDEFSGKQRKLASFFAAAAPAKKATPIPPTEDAAAAGDSMPSSAAPTSKAEAAAAAAAAVAASQSAPTPAAGAAPTEPGGEETLADEEPSLAEALFALQAPGASTSISNPNTDPPPRSDLSAAGGGPEAAGLPSGPSAPTGATPSSLPEPTPPPPAPLAPRSSGKTAKEPSPSKRSPAAPSRAPPSSSSSSSSKKAQAKPTKGQMKLQSFFTKPTKPRPTEERVEPEAPAGASASNEVATKENLHSSASEGRNEATQPHSQSSDAVRSFDDNDNASTSASLQHNGSAAHAKQPQQHQQRHQRTASSSSSTSIASSATRELALDPHSSDEPSAADRVEASLAWGAIFAPLPPPRCHNHNEPAKAWNVNKPGPNHNRKFWLCSRPVGPGYEKSGRARGDVNPEYRCNFFLWDSEWRAEAAKRRKGEAKGKEQASFAEVGRRRLEEADEAPHKRVRGSRSS